MELFSSLLKTNKQTPVLGLLVNIAAIYVAYKFIIQPLNEEYLPIETFVQSEPYIYMQNEDCYDEFYCSIYQELNNTDKRVNWELVKLLQMTMPDTKHSVFLDVGSGTGHTINQLLEAGYKAYGIDNSQAMIDLCEETYPNVEVQKGCVTNGLLFEDSTFTHILCTDFTIYHLEDKKKFFANCLKWLQPNGYLVLHLAERTHFNAVSPLKEDELEWKPIIPKEKKQNNKIVAEYEDFKYEKQFFIPIDVARTNKVSLREKFTHKVSKNVRQNEITYFMEEISDIIKLAKKMGFVFHAKTDLKELNGEEHQYLYILEKPM
jgi:SAM-dependent methyltransferase